MHHQQNTVIQLIKLQSHGLFPFPSYENVQAQIQLHIDSTCTNHERSTNIPWQLDAAIRRRFQRRVHISLPDQPARMRMFELAVGTTPCELKADDYKTLGKLSEGYSGSDIAIAVQDALMQPVRKIQTATHYKKVEVDGMEKLTPCSPGDAGAIEMSWTEVDTDQLLEPPLQVKDFIKAIKSSRPTVSGEDLKRSAEWTLEFGSEGA